MDKLIADRWAMRQFFVRLDTLREFGEPRGRSYHVRWPVV